MNNPGISWDRKVWSELLSRVEVLNAVSCSFQVQDDFDEKTSRWGHSRGTDFRLTDAHISEDDITPQSDKDTKEDDRMTKTADTALSLHNLNLPHVTLHLRNVLIVYYRSDWSWTNRQTESLLVHTRTILYGLLGKHNKTE
jgi:hypothetical protein